MDLKDIKQKLDANPAAVSDRELLELYKCCGSPLLKHQAVVPPAEARDTAAKVAQPASPNRAINPFAEAPKS